jgi:hypothetical protein
MADVDDAAAGAAQDAATPWSVLDISGDLIITHSQVPPA